MARKKEIKNEKSSTSKRILVTLKDYLISHEKPLSPFVKETLTQYCIRNKITAKTRSEWEEIVKTFLDTPFSILDIKDFKKRQKALNDYHKNRRKTK